MEVHQVSENQENSTVILESPEVRSFIASLLLERPDGFLEPKVSFEDGVSYPGASNLLSNRKGWQVNTFLKKLSKAGLLDRTLIDKLVACPSCNNARIYSKYQCDKCKSINISAVEIVEHKLCGYTGAKTNFSPDSKQPDFLVCPKCKQSLGNEDDYRKLGKTFECASCKTRFDTPPIVHDCKKCGKRFTYKDAEYEPVYEYRASQRMKEIFSSGTFSLNTIADWLKDRGFRVEAPKEVTGTSKESHRFDIVASAGVMENLLLGDFVSSVNNKSVIAAFAKKYDVNQNAKSFIVTYEKVPESIETLARTYGISIIVVDPQNAVSLNDQLSRMVGGTPQVLPLSSPPDSKLPVVSKKSNRRFTHPPRAVAKTSERNDQLTISRKPPRAQTFEERSQRKNVTRGLRRAEKKVQQSQGDKDEQKSYLLENDFATESSDDIYLTSFNEID
jgi:uncharacterized protein YbaR (Trm112 family)